MAGLIAKHHTDEDAARAYLEAKLWPNGPICPHCKAVNHAYRLNGESTRDGVYKCAECRKPFTVTVGTIFEDSKIPLHKWLFAIYLMCSSKKGISAHQLWRNLWGTDEKGNQLGSYKTAWFMAHRIRWALGQEPVSTKLKGIVEVDETWIGGKIRPPARTATGTDPRRNPRANKVPVVAILERNGDVRSRAVERVTSENLRPIMREVIAENSVVMTDSATTLKFPASEGGHEHHTVNHFAKEYVRHEGDLTVTTNTVEGYFGIIKRGLHGIYHHVGKAYLDQYLREFDYRYNVRKLNDQDRTVIAIKKTSGKRLMLKEPKQGKM